MIAMHLAVLALALGASSLAQPLGDCEIGQAPARASAPVGDDVRRLEYEWGNPLPGCDFVLSPWELRVSVSLNLGTPIESCERLDLGGPGGILTVRRREQLAGHVLIDSPEDALRYVRLFTSPAIVYMLEPPLWLEVVAGGAVDEAFVFGRRRYLPANRWAIGWWRQYGFLTDQEWRKLELQTPVVLRVAEGFVVIRALFQVHAEGLDDWLTDEVCWVAESVSTDGKIGTHILGRRRIPLWLTLPHLK